MAIDRITVALISDVFFDADGGARLRARLIEAAEGGAELAVLPEIPLCRWAPATRQSSDDDAEPVGGPRHRLQADLAAEIGIGLVGGAIVVGADGARRNTALVFDARGELITTYAKLHVPHEPGFWEKDHYEPGVEPPHPIDAFGMPVGVQICSDINRPEGCHLLGAQGCEVVLAPRSTEAATYDRWRCVFRANALTSTLYVASVNRPSPEDGVLIGGASFAVSPEDEVLAETTDPVSIVTLHHDVIEKSRRHYPGYLDVRADLYAATWDQVQQTGGAGHVAKGHWEE